MACEGECDLNLRQLFHKVLLNHESTVSFLVDHGVIKDTYKCPKCDSALKVNNLGKFRCENVFTVARI